MKKLRRLLAWGAAGAAAVYLTMRLFLPVGLPFAFGLLLAHLVRRPTAWLQRRAHLPRALASPLCVTLASAAALGALYLLGRASFSGAQALARHLPQALGALLRVAGQLRSRLVLFAQKLPAPLSAAATEGLDRLLAGGTGLLQSASGWLMELAGRLIAFVPELTLFFFTALLSAYLFSAQGPQLRALAGKYLPEHWCGRLRAAIVAARRAIGLWCRTQLCLSLVVFVLLCAGLFLLRRKNALLLALLIALVDALPVLGAGTVLLPWSLGAYLWGKPGLGTGLVVLYAIVSLTRTMLEPRLLGRQVGLHPLVTLLALYGGYRLFGVAGMLFVPVSVLLTRQLYEGIEAQRGQA